MSLFSELKRRNVFRVAIAYLAAAWLLVEVLSALFDIFGSPDWLLKSIVALLAVGWPIALAFSWAYEITPEGLKKTEEVDQSQSITHATAKRLDEITIGLIVVALAVLLLDRFWLAPRFADGPVVADQASMDESEIPAADTSPQVPPNSIAVLPFVNMSPDPGQEYFADGISEELLNLMARVKGLKVAARTSAFRFKNSDADVAEIAEALNVSNVLEGSVRKDGNQVRITAQLIDAENGYHLWSESFDRDLNDIFRIQDEIARSIVDALKVELLGSGGQAVSSHPTDMFETYDLYLLGRHHMHQRTPESMPKAIELFQQVVEMDPDYAPAWSGLADSHLLSHLYADFDRERAIEQGMAAAQKAVALDPDLGETHASLGLALMNKRQYEQAEQALRTAIDLNPNYAMAHNWLTNTLLYQRRPLADYLKSNLDAAEADPLHPMIAANVAGAFRKMGRLDMAESRLREVLNSGARSLFVPTQWVDVAIERGDLVQAHRWAQRGVEGWPSSPRTVEKRYLVELLLGRRESAAYWLNRIPASQSRRLFWLRSKTMNAGGKYAEWAEYAENVVRSLEDDPVAAFPRLMKGCATLLSENAATAASILEKTDPDVLARAQTPRLESLRFGYLATSYWQLGAAQQAAETAQSGLGVVENARERGFDMIWIPHHRAMMLLLLNRRDDALDALDQSYDRGWRSYHDINFIPLMDKLIGGEPRYIAFKQKVLADIDRMRKEVESRELAEANVN